MMRASGTDEAHARAMGALDDVAVAAGGAVEARQLADIVVDRARLVAGGDAAVLRWLDVQSQSFQLLAASGTEPGLAGGIPLDSETAIGDAFKSGQPVIVNDYPSSGRTTEWGMRNGISAQVAVPLLVDARPVGTLAVLSFSGHAYDEADARFLSLLAAIVAPALEAARLNREVTRQARTTTQIYEALPVMVVVYDRHGMPTEHNSAAEAAFGEHLRAIRARTVALYREDGSPVPQEERPVTMALRLKKPVRGVVVGLGDPDRRWLYLDAVPLLDDAGEVEAIVSSSIDITALKAAEDRLRDDAERLRRLIAIQTELNRAELTEPEINRLVVTRAQELSGAPGASLQMLDGDHVLVAAGAGFGHELVGSRLPAKGNPLRGCVEEGCPESTADALVDPRCGEEIAGEAGIRSLVMAPVRHQDQVIGGLQLQSPLPGGFAEGADTGLELLAGFAGSAITRARAARAERERLETVIQAQHDLSVNEPDLDRLLQLLAEHTLKMTAAESALVLMPEGDGLVPRAGAGLFEGPRSGQSLPMNASLAGLAYRSRQVQWSADALNDSRAHAPTARQRGVGSLIHAPLVTGGNVVGVVSVASSKVGALDETDVRTVEMIAGFAAAAFERATTSRRLRSSEQRTRAVMENAPDPIIVIDSAGLIVDFNPAASRQFLRPRLEMIGEHAIALLAAKHAAAFGRWLKDGKTAGSAEYAGQRFEATGRRSDGTEFPMEIAIANLAEDRRLAAAFLRDLTLREKLRESRDRLAAVVSAAPVMLLACDVAGIVTVAEGRGFDALGVTPETVVGTDVRELFDHQPEVLEALRRAVTGESLNGQIHLERKDVYLEGAAGPIRDAAGEIIGVTAVLTDVSDRARAEAAQHDSEAKSRLMAMMNHEVRTPLNSILGFAHLLADPRTGDLNDKQRRFVTNIHDSGNHLLTLVNDSLDLARLDAGRAGVNPADMPVTAVIAQAVDQVRPLADARSLVLTAQASDDVVMHADQRHVLQILLNLLANAVRHTQPGGSVTISDAREGDQVAIKVTDTGDGIAREDLGRIFEEFFQASNHAPGGIGLGLAISRRLAKMMGGSIEVESELGRGSAFTLLLPAAGPARVDR